MAEETKVPEAPAQPSPESQKELNSRLVKLIGLAADAAKAGDMDAMLDSAGEIATLKKQIEGVQKAAKAKLLTENQAEISKLLLKITTKFDQAYATLKDDIKQLGTLGHDVEIVRFTVDVADEAHTGNANRSCVAGPKTKARTSTGTSGGSKSTRTVTLSDGTSMKTREFVDMYATDEERSSKTFESWPTAMAEKIAKRVGATIA